jgi:hypothetical protein
LESLSYNSVCGTCKHEKLWLVLPVQLPAVPCLIVHFSCRVKVYRDLLSLSSHYSSCI